MAMSNILTYVRNTYIIDFSYDFFIIDRLALDYKHA